VGSWSTRHAQRKAMTTVVQWLGAEVRYLIGGQRIHPLVNRHLPLPPPPTEVSLFFALL
jgi:hypothetical protein